MAHALSSYVPHLLWQRLANGQPFTAHEASAMPAAVMISDLQGFTGLVDTFHRAGRKGLEELTAALNGYFADLVEVVNDYGGDVLYVAGDGFFCFWPQQAGEPLGDAVLRSVQAGLAVQARLNGRRAGYGEEFATRIGIGAGPLTVTFAGGLNGRWELIATGEALRDGVRAERIAKSGDVAVSQHAFSLLGERCQATPIALGHFAISQVKAPLPQIPAPARHALDHEAELLRPFLPPAVLHRMIAPEPEWLAELRTVTVMMVDLPTLDHRDPKSVAQTHQSVLAIQEAVERFEGTIKLDVDDKGILLMVVFGLPPRAHEDDAQRAVFAAWAVQATLEAHALTCGIGIATGRCFCGPVGSDLRREYVLRGPVINLAARLMQATRSYVACDDVTVEAVRGRVDFEALPPITLKWKPQPVPVFRAISKTQPRRRIEAALIGRVLEQEYLNARLIALAQDRRNSTVLVEAEAGLGKSTLVAALGKPAAALEVRTFVAAADSIERSTAYYAWRGVFAQLLGVAGDADLVTARERIAQYLERVPEVERLMPLLSSVLPMQFADNELTREMTGDVRADNTVQLLTRLLLDASEKAPSLLIVEDAHWLDSSSWSLLFSVLKSVRPLLTVITSRPESAQSDPNYRRLIDLPSCERLRLESLSLEQTVALIQRRLGVAQVPEALARFAQERVSGHPFFCEELIRAMVDSGAIAVTDGQCTVGDLDLLGLPTTVEGVILSRLDRLTANQQLCLKIGAVFGRTFLSRALIDTHPIENEREHIAAHLAVLAELDLTELDFGDTELAYRFKHVITQEVTYDLMPLAQRQPLHRAVAEWHEKAYQADLAPHFALLAHHWERAEVAERAASYYERAGQQALRAGAFKEAQLFFDKLMRLAQSGGLGRDAVRHALWEKGLGTAWYFLGDLKQSRVHIENALVELDRRVPIGTSQAQRALLAAALVQLAHRILPERFLGRRIAEQMRREEAVNCYTTLAQIYYLDGEPAPVLAYLTVRGLNVGEEAGPSPGLARILVMVAVIAGLMGRQSWADWYARRAMAMAQQQSHYVAAAYVCHIQALLEAQRGNWLDAKASNLKTMALIQEIGDYNLEAEAWVVRATVNLAEGNFLAAPNAWQNARRLATRNGNQQIICWSYLDEVDTAVGVGDAEAAQAALEAALAIATPPTDGGTLIDKARALAMTRLRQRRYQDAIAAADEVIAHVSRQPPTGYHWADYAASAVEVYLRVLGTASAAEFDARGDLMAKARRGVAIVRRLARIFWNVRPRAHLLKGLLEAREQRIDDAIASFRRAQKLALDMRMPYEEARALVEIAEIAPDEPRPAETERAITLFGQLGAEFERRRALVLQGRGAQPGAKESSISQLAS